MIPQNRKYKTIASINLTEEFKILKDKIELINFIFENENAVNFDILWDYISKFLDNTQNYELISFILYLFAIIRPKQINLFSQLPRKFILKLIDTNNVLFARFRFLHSNLKLFDYASLSEDDLSSKSFKYKNYDNKYELLQSLMIDDDVDGLKNYINTNTKFKNKIIFYPNQYQFITSHIKIQNKASMEKLLSLLDFCAYVASPNCFKFLVMNGCENTFNQTNQMAICGGNIEIIHILESQGQSFDCMFINSIRYHHTSISEWLLANYQCEVYDLNSCICYLNYPAFLFFLLNDLDPSINKNSSSLISTLCLTPALDVDLIKYFIEKGVSINKDPNNGQTPLTILCTRQIIDSDLIKYFISKGVDINAGSTPPLILLCSRTDLDIELIKYFIENGADINITPKDKQKESKYLQINTDLIEWHFTFKNINIYPINYTKTPLISLCLNEKFDFELCKYLIEHGADINQEMNGFSVLSLISKNYLEVTIDNIKYLADHGAKTKHVTMENYEYSPLYQLCKNGNANIEILKYFVEFSEYESIIGHGVFIYGLCCNKRVTIEALEYLIQKGEACTFDLSLEQLEQNPNSTKEMIRLIIDNGGDIYGSYN